VTGFSAYTGCGSRGPGTALGVKRLNLPLNLSGNGHHPFHMTLTVGRANSESGSTSRRDLQLNRQS